MSRIGNKPIAIPKGVQVTLGDLISVKGPKGQLQQDLRSSVTVEQDGDKLVVKRVGNDREARATHGLMRALIANMVTGVSEGFERKLEINGVGYRAEVSGQKLTLQLGYSHPVVFPLPDGVAAKVNKNVVELSGIDNQVLGAAAAKIRGFRAPEPYKGKGVKYLEERIVRKAGKAAS